MPHLPAIIAAVLAQATHKVVGPTWEWWSQWGPLGIGGMLVAGGAVFFFYRIFAPDEIAKRRAAREDEIATRAATREYEQKKRELELAKAEKQNALYDTLRESEILDRDWKRRMEAALAMQPQKPPPQQVEVVNQEPMPVEIKEGRE